MLIPSWWRFICPPRAWDLSNGSSQNLQRNSLCSLAPFFFFVSVCNKRKQTKLVNAWSWPLAVNEKRNRWERFFTICMILHMFAKQVLFFEYCTTILAYLFLEGKWWILTCETIIITISRSMNHHICFVPINSKRQLTNTLHKSMIVLYTEKLRCTSQIFVSVLWSHE